MAMRQEAAANARAAFRTRSQVSCSPSASARARGAGRSARPAPTSATILCTSTSSRGPGTTVRRMSVAVSLSASSVSRSLRACRGSPAARSSALSHLPPNDGALANRSWLTRVPRRSGPQQRIQGSSSFVLRQSRLRSRTRVALPDERSIVPGAIATTWIDSPITSLTHDASARVASATWSGPASGRPSTCTRTLSSLPERLTSIAKWGARAARRRICPRSVCGKSARPSCWCWSGHARRGTGDTVCASRKSLARQAREGGPS